MRTLIILALFTILTAMILTQPVIANDFRAEVEYALKNVQQVGNFYFLPFNSGSFFNGFDTAKVAQITLTILDEFEKKKGLDVIHFQLVRDGEARTAGILLKAAPNKK